MVEELQKINTGLRVMSDDADGEDSDLDEKLNEDEEELGLDEEEKEEGGLEE